MAWYYGTFSCGHEGRVNIIGPVKDREWKKEREFRKMCPKCWGECLEERRQRKNKEAAEKAKEMELPKLTGSEKQIAWANTLRQEFIDKLDSTAVIREAVDELKICGIKIKKEEVLKVRDYILENKTSSKFYIDNRSEYLYKIIEGEMEEALKSDVEKYQEELIEKEKIESTVYPENAIAKSSVEIEYTEDEIELKFEKNYDFIELVKENGYTWNGSVWFRELTKTTGDYKDRVAEIGNKLLNAGFPIMILDEELRNNAINGKYEEECTRWIYARISGKYKGHFSISWNGYNDELYTAAKSLPSARWDGCMVVKPEYFKEVQDFADIYEFNFTDGANKLIKECKKKLQGIDTIKPSKPDKDEENADGLEKILESNPDILTDLRDD